VEKDYEDIRDIDHLTDNELRALVRDELAELFGTTDVQQSIEGAIPWNPPDGPTPEGIEGSEDTPSELRDDI